MRQPSGGVTRAGSAARGYNARWRKYRLGWLRKHPCCGDRLDERSVEHSLCARSGRAVLATDVDHIKPHHGDTKLFWSPDNHQSLCGICHDSFKSRIERTGEFGWDETGRPLDPRHPWNEGEGGSKSLDP
jgi:5-methylcytosine-specific restriction endonuclease McrA